MPSSNKGMERCETEGAAQAVSSWVEQRSSRLLQLPGELRNMIYDLVFGSIRLIYGKRPINRYSQVRMKSPPHSLALLHTCQQTYQELRFYWMKHVLFIFEDPETLVNKLSPLPAPITSQIRHLRISGNPLYISAFGYGLWYPDIDLNAIYRTVPVTQLLPHLFLNTLTVLVKAMPTFIGYLTVDTLIARSNGWKELRIICETSEILGYPLLGVLEGER